MNHGTCEVAIVGAGTAGLRAYGAAAAGVDGDDRALVRPYAVGRLLGATIVATGGEHLAPVLAMAIEQGMDAASFADGAWYRPTIEEVLQGAARQIGDATRHGRSPLTAAHRGAR